MSRTTQDLVDEVRQQTDEANTVGLEDSEILATLNRGQRKATNITGRKYEDMFWQKQDLSLTGNTAAYDLPTNLWGKRIEAVTITYQGRPYKVTRIDNNKRAYYSSPTTITVPRHYALTKHTIEFFPTPAGSLTAELHYIEAPETLVLPQGRITSVNAASNYLLVDDLGDDLSTSTTGFGCYINVVDWRTGKVKGSYQINSLDTSTKKITIKTASLTRSSVLGKTIDTELSDDINVDDYVCLVTGTCVPELPDAYTDYYVQFGVLEIRRRFGEPTQEEVAALLSQEEELKKMGAGRENRGRVTRKNLNWRRL